MSMDKRPGQSDLSFTVKADTVKAYSDLGIAECFWGSNRMSHEFDLAWAKRQKWRKLFAWLLGLFRRKKWGTPLKPDMKYAVTFIISLATWALIRELILPLFGIN